jgi:membrane dipeptidase
MRETEARMERRGRRERSHFSLFTNDVPSPEYPASLINTSNMFIIDAHLDLAMNAMEWNRDLRLPVSEINEREKYLTDKPDRGKATVSLPELRKANIGLVVATQIARSVKPGNTLPGWSSPEQAWAHTQGQLAWYKSMEEEGEMFQVKDLQTLEEHISRWLNHGDDHKKPVGYILSLEGADSLVTIKHLEKAYQYGLRAVGPAHYGEGRYAQGTDATGSLVTAGKDLLKEMESLNIILDATHLCDDCFWEALDNFHGPVWASHNNCRALVNHNRQFSDDQLKALIERGSIIGTALDAWMVVPGWVRGRSDPESMQCDLNSVCIGSDLDGDFGKEQCPYDLDTIADLPKLSHLLNRRGYLQKDLENIMHDNWLRFLRSAWS